MPADTSLTLEVVATIKARQRVDIVGLFSAMDLRQQQRYRSINVSDLGFEHEWERPLAFLWPEERDLVPDMMVTGSHSPVEGDIEDARMSLIKRGPEYVTGKAREWTEADFETLTAQVPWVRHFHDKLGTPDSQHDLDRLPGPNDVPLF